MLSFALALAPLLAAIVPSCATQVAAPATLASLYSLATSTSIPFPSATLSSSDAQSFLVSDWSLSKGKIQQGAENLAFVADPFPNKPAPGSSNTSTGPVLQVKYAAGGVGSSSSGAQLFTLWNSSNAFNSMMISYEVAFDSNFDFVKGGKLPGLRGGPDPNGCSGGDAATGTNCFSTRLMWRTNGAGEVYAYIPTPNNICSNSDFICNDDGFGTSIDRGSFSFTTGQWHRVTLMVNLNSPTSTVNGQVQLYFNNVQALSEDVLYYRSVSSLSVGGMYFSTFFGGSDDSWAPPSDSNAYFRNIELWGSSAASNLTGATVSAAPASHRPASAWVAAVLAAACAALGSVL
ncbi:uncharacterized protein BXZ73DRAFT_42689 [Epithele typhae]|uniref:uncharacterized protein n=1 Tax=Epithele typhae TaxID=378194 RepID=UPI0020077A1A|nr:uncharacterized protein BXZ73DRAFT_42689 [Epithele typhae]KAH9940513.1 hypothetical protein BXZ73DRAFT_42689 [Epithele typhae]